MEPNHILIGLVVKFPSNVLWLYGMVSGKSLKGSIELTLLHDRH
jgi:hypothetical protein